ncbi:MAG: hypothetical protein AB1758_34175 [Candidatus Eremiobacterota bacterium]
MSVVQPGLQGRLVKVAEGNIGSPRISGDGSTVVWNQMVDGQLEVMRWKNGQVECLSKDPRPDMHADVSDDGDTVVWTRHSNENPTQGGSWDVVMWKNGELRTIAADPVANEFTCRISRDGNTVVYDSDTNGKWGFWHIEKWRDGQTERVTEGFPGTSQEFPFVSGDGQRVFWREYAKGDSDIWMRDQNKVIKPVVATDSEQVTPQISPDGCKLVWSDDRLGDSDVLMTDLDHGNQVRVVSGERKADETWATMSADGSVVAWTHFDRSDEEQTRVNIYVRRGDEDPTQVTVEDGGLNSWPQVSDDGTRLAWQWQDRENWRNSVLYLLEMDPEPAR